MEEDKELKISFHGDADGITSAVLLLKGMDRDLSSEDIVTYSPKLFGDTSDNPDIILDQKPNNSTWEGLCYDHHPGHSEDRRYSLESSDKLPTSGLIYNKFRNKLPDSDKWKMAIGMDGDGQWDAVPSEVWKNNKFLRASTSLNSYQKYGNLNYNTRPVYSCLSTLINAPARLGGSNDALSIFYDARKPVDILFDDYLRECHGKVKKEMKQATNNMKLFEFDDIAYAEYGSEARLWVTPQLRQESSDTTITLNTNSMKVSVRGPRAIELSKEFRRHNISAGGHKGYCGAILPYDMTKSEFREIIIEVVNS